ncbi:RraA family protein [Roseomonas xinghualingensis]|uniref:RraA family protein n=1 Tax=Roseomonas xinghualingensis TaxID=2986475 RepID=UPI0021F2265E|nr:hypothetical protein [Roseomonas sp. SXEYE001]MCV4209802.1 hypothetical protein [Roseomonas sp. SXEYE001]
MSDAELLDRCKPIPVSAWSDALDQLDVEGVIQGIPLRSGAGRICGFATTARQIPGLLHEFEKSEFAVGRLVDAAQPGRVLVVDVGGQPISTMGGLAAAGAKMQGVEGVVIDGACRDVDEICNLGLWLASRHVSPTTGKGRLKLLPIGVSVTVGGVRVEQDDLVVGDETGIIVIPRRLANEVLPRAEKLLAADQAVEERMRDGMSFSAAGAATGYLPPYKS